MRVYVYRTESGSLIFKDHELTGGELTNRVFIGITHLKFFTDDGYEIQVSTSGLPQ